MNKQSLEEISREAEKEQKRRDKRKRKRMPVSGVGVKRLQKIIVNSVKGKK